MRNLKIKFVDFWFGFEEKDNYFTKLLSLEYRVEFSDDPEILIYSCYGRNHLKYKCIRIFYSAENVKPNFNGCDYAITFDYNNNPRHYRFPLYGIYLENEDSTKQFTLGYTKDEATQIWRNKTKFCCMIVSNGGSKERLHFFEKLSEYKRVDSGGKVLNNVGGPVKDKLEFIKDYRFVIAFENSSHPGYTTEKIIEPLVADCIPLYWGDPFVTKEINKDCFLEQHEGKTLESFIQEIIEIDQNEEMALNIIMTNKFVENKIPESIHKKNLSAFLNSIIKNIDQYNPIAKKWTGTKYYYREKIIAANEKVYKGIYLSIKKILKVFK